MRSGSVLTLGVLLAISASVMLHARDSFGYDTQSQTEQDANAGSEPQQNGRRANDRLPRTEESNSGAGESSSRGTKIDLAPPVGEAPAIGVGDVGEVQEMKPWNPHKADKSIEVGNFYFKRKNYRAAESRFLEALHWQDNNAVATFRLAETEEKLGKPADALKYYDAYLKILPNGEFASQAREGIDRLKGKKSAAAQPK